MDDMYGVRLLFYLERTEPLQESGDSFHSVAFEVQFRVLVFPQAGWVDCSSCLGGKKILLKKECFMERGGGGK